MKMTRNRSFLITLLITMLIGYSFNIAAQSKQFVLENTEIVTIKNKLTGREHELIICLPYSYNDSITKKYPVFYFLDAYWHTPLLSSIYRHLRYDNVIPEMIMVGLSYAGENVDYDDLRMRDLTPTKLQFNPNTGDGPKFLQFIEESVIPYIELNYRADMSIRGLGGASAGGLFTLYAMYEKPNLFDRYIAISPFVSSDNGYLFRRDSIYSKTSKKLPVRLYLSVAGDEYPAFRNPIIKFQKQIENDNYEGMSLLNYLIEGERHAGNGAEGYTRGLRWIFKDIAPTGPSGLARAYGETN